MYSAEEIAPYMSDWDHLVESVGDAKGRDISFQLNKINWGVQLFVKLNYKKYRNECDGFHDQCTWNKYVRTIRKKLTRVKNQPPDETDLAVKEGS